MKDFSGRKPTNEGGKASLRFLLTATVISAGLTTLAPCNKSDEPQRKPAPVVQAKEIGTQSAEQDIEIMPPIRTKTVIQTLKNGQIVAGMYDESEKPVKIQNIDDHGVGLSNGMKLKYDVPISIGEFVLTTTYKASKGPAGTVIISITNPDTDEKPNP